MTEKELDAKKVVAWLNKNWQGSKMCPICKNNNWTIGSGPVELREFHGGNLIVEGPVIPVIPITCMVCGHTLFFNAIVAHLVESASPPEENIPASRSPGAQ